MALYHTNELVFDLPASLKDKTHHLFSLSDDGPSPFNLVISRHDVALEETLESYGARLAAEVAKALPKFELKGSGVIMVAGQPSWGLEYRWQNQGQWLHQRQANVFYQPAADRKQVVQITATVAGEFTDDWKQILADILGSMRLRPPVA